MTAENSFFSIFFHLIRAISTEICRWAKTLNICKHSPVFFHRNHHEPNSQSALRTSLTYLIYTGRQKQM